MTEIFLKKLVAQRPQLGGGQLFINVVGFPEISCLLNSDASISTADNPATSFSSAKALFCAVTDQTKRFPRQKDIFFAPSRKSSFRHVLRGGKDCEPPRPSGQRFRPCPGFTFSLLSWNNFLRSFNDKIANLRVDGDVFRSVQCSQQFCQFRRSSTRCCECARACKKARNFIRTMKYRQQICCGLSLALFQDVIDERKWNGDRKQFSPLESSGNRIYSNRCNGSVAKGRKICDCCVKLRSVLYTFRKHARQHKTNEEHRLLYTPKRFLTDNDRVQKETLMKDRSRSLEKKAQRAEKEVQRLTMELEKYKPQFVENQPAIRGLKAFMDAETLRIVKPTCRWKTDVGETCGLEFETGQAVMRHVCEVHLQAQHDSSNDVQSLERPNRYSCRWAGCHCPARFRSRLHCYSHIRSHMVSKDDKAKLALFRQQCVKANFQPFGQSHQITTNVVADDLQSQLQGNGAHEVATTATSNGNMVQLGSNSFILVADEMADGVSVYGQIASNQEGVQSKDEGEDL